MSVYYGKLLQLEKVKHMSGKYFLQIKFSFEDEEDIFLEVDEFTSISINNLIQSQDKYKYRLSFNNYFNTRENQHISNLTRTHLDHSNTISFPCSEDYINKLTSIKNIQHISDLDDLDFVSRASNQTNSKEEKQEQTEKQKKQKNTPSFSRLSFVGLCALVFVFLSFLSLDYLNQNNVNKISLPSATEVNTQVYKEEYRSFALDNANLFDDNNIIDEDDNILLEEQPSIEYLIPFIELEQSLTYSIPKGNVALTFDDGPSKYSIEIVDLLKEYGVGGTFFFLGNKVKEYPDYVEYVHSNGYSIGGHSLNHFNMPTISSGKQEIELVGSMNLLEEIANEKITLFRPPYGAFNENLKDLIYENQYKMVLWNLDPKDWETCNSNMIYNHIKNSDPSGSIIILHESQAVINALPRIIEHLQELDLEIVNLK